MMREKLLMAATLTLALRLFANFNWSFSDQRTGEPMNLPNSTVITVTQLHRYIRK